MGKKLNKKKIVYFPTTLLFSVAFTDISSLYTKTKQIQNVKHNMWKTGIMSYTGNSQRELCKYPKQVHKQECGCRKRELTSRKQKAGTSHVQKEATPPTPA